MIINEILNFTYDNIDNQIKISKNFFKLNNVFNVDEKDLDIFLKLILLAKKDIKAPLGKEIEEHYLI